MGLYESITLFGVLIVLAAIPSTSVVLVVTRSATLGIANGIAAAAGVVLGDLVFVILAILGLTVMAKAMGILFMFLKILAGFYLLWFGFSLFFESGSSKIKINEKNTKRHLIASFMAGFILTLGDIKAIIFYSSLLLVFINLPIIQAQDIVVVVFMIVFSVGSVKSVYAIFADKVTAYTQSANMETITRKIAGCLMIGTGSYLIINN